MPKHGTGGDFSAGLPGESSQIYGNLENKIQQLQAGVTSSATNTGIASTASFTWNNPLHKILSVTYAAAKTAITLNKSGWIDGEVRQLDIANIGGFGVQIILAAGTDTILGSSLGAGVGYTLLPGSDSIPSSTVLPASYQVTYVGNGVWKIR